MPRAPSWHGFVSRGPGTPEHQVPNAARRTAGARVANPCHLGRLHRSQNELRPGGWAGRRGRNLWSKIFPEMRRRLFTLAAGLSLLLCVLTIVGWAHSRRWFESYAIRFGHHGRQLLGVGIYPGFARYPGQYFCGVYFCWDTGEWPGESSGFHHLGYPAQSGEHPLARARLRFAGFGVRDGVSAIDQTNTTFSRFRVVMLPTWFVALATAILPVAWLRRERRRRLRAFRAARACCLACGYDLTGNISGVCPECGAQVQLGSLRVAN